MIPDEEGPLTPEQEAEHNRIGAQYLRWMNALSEREQKEADFCSAYYYGFNHGTDGHILRVLIAKLIDFLNDSEPVGGREYTVREGYPVCK